MPGRLSKADQSARTRSALVAAARALFAERGYEAVSAEEIATAAGVTTGALYHQFKTKRDVFRAAFEAVESDLTRVVAEAAAAAPDPWEGFLAAASVFFDAALSPEARQIVLIDGMSVLGWADWDQLMSEYGLGLTKAALTGLIAAGYMDEQPVDALAALLLGALGQGTMLIATADDHEAAHAEVRQALLALVSGLRRTPG